MNTTRRIPTPAHFARATVAAALVVTAFTAGAASFTHLQAPRTTSVTASGFGWDGVQASNSSSDPTSDPGTDPSTDPTQGSGFGWE